MLTMLPSQFLTDYPLDLETQSIVDAANNGKLHEFTRLLNESTRAISGLSASSHKMSASSASGLLNYHRAKIRALISLIDNPAERKALKLIFVGDEK
jgi:hypothetical protein